MDHGYEFDRMQEEIEHKVNIDSEFQVQRVTVPVVRDALKQLKANKKDSIFDASSDLYLNGPPELVQHLTSLIKLYLVHGYVTPTVLLCTLLPLVKDGLGDLTLSKNYRAIAGGCLLLKVIDLVILSLEKDKLNFDCMQFAYQVKSSTSMCTWTVTAVIDHFNRNGLNVFGAAMDMTKAFDMVEWCELFKSLSERNIDAVFLRLVLFIYCNQQCAAKWCGRYSSWFSVKNGVRQGGVSSGIFFAIYIDNLLSLLRKAKIGCHINGIFYGAMVFADDIFLLSPSRNGLQVMVNLCHEFVSRKNLKFGTDVNPSKSKTKCILFSKRPLKGAQPKKVTLSGNELPWVSQVKHLGHVLQTDNSMKIDVCQKRGSFIAKINSLLQEFHHVSSNIFLKLMHAYTTSLYGSNTWDILSPECERIYTSYNVTIRKVLGVDRRTHRYLIEPLSGSFHLKTLVACRYVTFATSLVNSCKLPVRFLARLCEGDQRTVLGRTLSALRSICSLDDSSSITARIVKQNMKYMEAPQHEQWRQNIASELLAIKDGNQLELEGFSCEECVELLQHICVS